VLTFQRRVSFLRIATSACTDQPTAHCLKSIEALIKNEPNFLAVPSYMHVF